MLRIIKASNLIGQSIIAHLQQTGFSEIVLHLVDDKKTRNLDVALEAATAIERPNVGTESPSRPFCKAITKCVASIESANASDQFVTDRREGVPKDQEL